MFAIDNTDHNGRSCLSGAISLNVSLKDTDMLHVGQGIQEWTE